MGGNNANNNKVVNGFCSVDNISVPELIFLVFTLKSQL